jgi:arsenite methyltransferase
MNMGEVPTQDRWAAWVLERSYGGDPDEHRRRLEYLRPIRDRVLEYAKIRQGDVVLDVGAGDGLIAFGALERVGPSGKVLINDISADLLSHTAQLARDLGVEDRCEFIQASADDLSPILDASVDVVTTRSVLIYLPYENKKPAFEEFHRVLRPDGRFSLFEPINRFSYPESEDVFLGYDVTPIIDLANRVKQAYGDEDESLIDFDERDLLAFAEGAGFSSINLTLEAWIGPNEHGFMPTTWDAFLDISGNPCIPTLREAMQSALTPEESERFEAHLRPLVETQQSRERGAVAYLHGAK